MNKSTRGKFKSLLTLVLVVVLTIGLILVSFKILENREKIIAEIKEIAKSAYGYTDGVYYVKGSDVVKLKIAGNDRNYLSSSLTANDITVKVGGVTVSPSEKSLSDPETTSTGVQYILTLKGLSGNGILSVEVAGNVVSDKLENVNDSTKKDINEVVVDNDVPKLEITKVNYNTIHWKATDTNISGYAVTSSPEAPGTWTSVSSSTEGNYTIDSNNAGTYYFWIKDKTEQMARVDFTTYKLSKSEGEGTTLTIREKSSTGTELGTCCVLSGTNIYFEGSVKTGYDNFSLKYQGVETASGSTKTISSESVTVATTAKIINYPITYELNGGTASGNPETYTINTNDFTLVNPTRKGYTFKGWSGTGLTGDENKSVTISKGSTGAKTFTANWNANPLIFNGATVTSGYTYNPSDKQYYEFTPASNGTDSYSYTIESGSSSYASIPTSTTNKIEFAAGTPAGVQTVVVKAKDNNSLVEATATFKITFAKKAPTLTASNMTVVEGNSDTQTITYNGDGALSVSSSNTGVATTSISNKVVTVNGVWNESRTSNATSTITITAVEGTNYAAKTATFTATVKPGNYQVGTTYYTSLADAYTPAESGTTDAGRTIKTMKNVSDSSTFTVASGKTIILDTNGKTLTRTATLTNNGTLTLTGSGTLTTASAIHLIINNDGATLNIPHTGTISNTNTGSYSVIYGSGSISKTGSGTISTQTSEDAIWMPSSSSATVTLSAGTITAKNYALCFRGATANISNMTITSSGGYTISNRSTGTMNITGGTVTNTSGVAIQNQQTGTINISGGTITGKTYGVTNASTGTVNITGGTVIGSTYGYYTSTASTLTMGTSDTTVSITSPIVRGGTYGYYGENSGAVLKLYDGVFQGTTGGIYQTTGSAAPTTPSGYGIFNDTTTIDSTTYKTAYLATSWDVSKNSDGSVMAFLTADPNNSGKYILTIRGTGAMKNFADYGDVPWVSYRSTITQVNVEEGVTSVGDRSFYAFSQITGITFPSTLTYIGTYSIYNCAKITGTITIPASVTSIGTNPFLASPATAYTVASGNTSFKVVDGVLYNYEGTQLVSYPYGKTDTSFTVLSTVTKINGYSCYGMKATSVTLPSKLKTIDFCAFQTSKLTSVTIPASVTSISSSFDSCTSLATVYLKSTTATIGSSAFTKLKSGSIIYTVSKTMADKFVAGTNYTAANTTIYYPPTVGKPSSQTIAQSATATFDATATAGNPTDISYQWQQSTDGGTSWSDISGATSSTYTTPATTVAMNGYKYRCVVSSTAYPNDGITREDISAVTVSEAATLTLEDKTAPTCTSVSITNVTTSGYDVYVYGVSDGFSGVNRVQFPTWTEYNGQDDLQSSWSTSAAAKGTDQGNGTWYFRVNRSAHNSEMSIYNTHIYLYDNAGNSACVSSKTANVPGILYFDANEGTVSTSNKTITNGSAYGELPTPTRDNYDFNGWFTAKTGGTQVTSETTVTSVSDHTLYAQWTKKAFYLDLNYYVDGTCYSSGYNSRIYTGLKVNGVDQGYVSDYWQELNYGSTWEVYGHKIDGETISDSQSGTITSAYSIEPSFYTYTVSRNNEYGSLSSRGITSAASIEVLVLASTTFSTSSNKLTFADGRSVTATANSYTGYTTSLSSWSTGSGTITTTGTNTANFTRSANTYTITYTLNGGTATGSNPTSYTIETNSFTLSNPTRTGYVFAGWTGSNGTTRQTSVTVSKGSTGNKTYAANWIYIVSAPSGSPTSFNYNGSSQGPTFTYDSSRVSVSGTTSATNAGSYTATFTLTDTTNNQWSDGTTAAKNIGWAINKITATAPVLANATYTYDGSAKTVTTSSEGNGGTLKYRYSTNNGASYTSWSTTKPTFTNAGTYYVQAFREGDTNYNSTAEPASTAICTINKVSLTPVSGTPLTFLYSGSAQGPTFSNYNTGLITGSGTLTATNTGAYTATFSLKDTTNYQWDTGSTSAISISWEIVKAQAILGANGNLTFLCTSTTYSAGDAFTNSMGETTVSYVYDVPTSSSSTSNIPWYSQRESVTSVNIDSSFKLFKPTSTAYWFYNFTNATSITNLGNIDVSEVTTMSNMFYYCSKVVELDISGWNNAKLTDTGNMFYRCSLLEVIYADSNWSNSKITSSSRMFYYCSKLVGGNGTKYSSSYVDKTRACIDTTSTKGYFTDSSVGVLIYTITLDSQGATTQGSSYVYEKYDRGIYSDAACTVPVSTSSAGSLTAPTKYYTVTYNYNGNGQSTSTANANSTFGGYYVQTGGSGDNLISSSMTLAKKSSYSSTAVFTNTYFSNDATIYAKWTDNGKVTLPTPSAYSGKHFVGWYSGSTKIGDAGASYTPTANITLTAHWEDNVVYTISLDNQGAKTAGSSAVYENYSVGIYSDSACSTAVTSSSAGSLTAPTKYYTVTYNYNGNGQSTSSANANSTFGGYYTAAGGSGTQLLANNMRLATSGSYSSTVNFTNTYFSSNSTIYAKWTSGSVTLPTPTKMTGYHCTGWYNGSTKIGDVGASYTPSADITLTAKWEKDVIYTITLNNQSATSAGSSYVYENYGIGIYSDSSCTTAVTSSSAGGMTAPQRKYTLTFDKNYSGSTSSTSTSTYTFNGYYTSTGGSGTKRLTNAMKLSTFSNTAYTANATLYAYWSGGSVSAPTNPTRTSYNFDGWYTEKVGGAKISFPYTPTANETIYAHWTLATVAVPTLSTTSYEYTGSTISPSFTYDSTKVTIGGTYSSTNVGTYTATFTLKDSNSKWEDGTTAAKSISWEISLNGCVASDIIRLYEGDLNTGTSHSSSTTTWKDLTGHQDGTVSSTSNWYDNGYLTDTGKYVNCGSQHLATNCTIEADFAVFGTASSVESREQNIIANTETGGHSLILTGGYFCYSAYINGAYQNCYAYEPVHPDVAYRISCTYDGSTMKIYMDGVLRGSKSVSGTVGAPTNNEPWVIGDSPAGTGVNNLYFHGYIGRVAIYERALTASEVDQNYKADLKSSKVNNISAGYTTKNLIRYYDAKYNAGASHSSSATTWIDLSDHYDSRTTNCTWGSDYASFDGSTNYAHCGYYQGTNLTVEAKFKASTIDSGERTIFSDADYGGVTLYTQNDAVGIGIHISGSWRFVTTPVSTGVSYVVTATYDGSTIKLYLDGVLKNSLSIAGSITIPSNNTVWMIGCNPTGSSAESKFFAGKIYRVTMYDRAITATEVSNNYNSYPPEAENPYVAKIGTTQYKTLAAAISAASTSGTTITMIDNTDESCTFPSSKSITLKLNGYTITGQQTCQGTLTVNGSGKFHCLSDNSIKVTGGTTTLNNVSWSNSYGAVWTTGGTCYVKNCSGSFKSGGASFLAGGGSIQITNGSYTATSCDSILNCQGGTIRSTGATLKATSCNFCCWNGNSDPTTLRFDYNSGTYGGGAGNFSGIFHNCLFTNDVGQTASIKYFTLFSCPTWWASPRFITDGNTAVWYKHCYKENNASGEFVGFNTQGETNYTVRVDSADKGAGTYNIHLYYMGENYSSTGSCFGAFTMTVN